MNEQSSYLRMHDGGPGGPGFELAVPAEPSALRTIRGALREWLAARGLTGNRAFDLILATNEAAANVVAHAYGSRASTEPGSLRVVARIDGAAVVVEVTDEGRWRRPARMEGGRGLEMISSLVDGMSVTASPSGTQVRMSQQGSLPT